ncbi:MAG: hypothetical protein ACKOUM_07940 [Sphingopyxis sp.]
MSNLLHPNGVDGDAAPVGSFIVAHTVDNFTPWANRGDGAAAPHGDGDGAAAADMPAVATVDELIETARAAAYADGLAAGQLAAQTALADERAALAQLAASLDALCPTPAASLAALLGETVERLMRELLGDTPINADLLAQRACAVAALLHAEIEPATLKLHPADMAIVPMLDVAVPVVADAGLDRGTVRLETATGWIEDSPGIRLDRLRAQFERDLQS